jgi:hypothetical protein
MIGIVNKAGRAILSRFCIAGGGVIYPPETTIT